MSTLSSSMLCRRDFLQRSAAAAAGVALAGAAFPQAAAAPAASGPYRFCAFTKYMQSLSFDELAKAIAEMGFSGVEAPVRQGGHFSMEEAPEKLPQLVAALAKQNVEITILCTDAVRPDQPHVETCLRAAKEQGIKHYRMGFHNYDLKKPILPQIEAIKPQMKDLAALNRELGMQALYQNHSGANMVGAAVWDIFRTLEDVDPAQVALAYDIRHATIEGGLSWPVAFSAVRDHIGALFVKDFQWKGKSAEHVPLGEGRVDPAFFKTVAETGYSGPVSVHVEYLKNGDAMENGAAIKRDFATLKKWLSV